MTENLPTLAVFDFDHTLIDGDSLWPFLCYACGTGAACVAVAETALGLGWRYMGNRNAAEFIDLRTRFKGLLLKKLLTGKKPEDIAPAVARLRQGVRWLPRWRQALIEHHAAGHHVVIASGSLDIYLPIILGDLPYASLVCTKMEAKDGALTGALLSGNCVRARKAQMVREYIETHGPFETSWGYGNYPHDVPMLNLVRHRILV